MFFACGARRRLLLTASIDDTEWTRGCPERVRSRLHGDEESVVVLRWRSVPDHHPGAVRRGFIVRHAQRCDVALSPRYGVARRPLSLDCLPRSVRPSGVQVAKGLAAMQRSTRANPAMERRRPGPGMSNPTSKQPLEHAYDVQRKLTGRQIARFPFLERHHGF